MIPNDIIDALGLNPEKLNAQESWDLFRTHYRNFLQLLYFRGNYAQAQAMACIEWERPLDWSGLWPALAIRAGNLLGRALVRMAVKADRLNQTNEGEGESE